ncbi:MAG TPA: glycosyltransferase family 1 protein [Oligoflexia bacterium]|nr:glycosyltransferase family 1 protein [Oligoflexia bacterium]HMP49541.1 glycosyltransferase family 1 protein [Oligoflexia bacterium]
MKKEKLRIAIDSRALEEDFRSHVGRGTGRYVKEVMPKLLSLAPEYGIECVPVGSKDLNLSAFQKKIRDTLPAGRVTFESQFALRKNIKNLKTDFAHFFFHGDAPAFPSTNQIISVLDLIPLKFPQLYQKGIGGLRYKFARYLENRAIRASSGLIAISEATKSDVSNLLQIESERIAVVPLGVSETFFTSLSNIADFNEKLKMRKKPALGGLDLLDSGYLAVYAGGIDPRKNISFLVNLIEKLNYDQEIKNSGGIQLVLAGKYADDDQLPGLEKLVKSKNLANKIILAGFLEESALLDLFSAANIFIFPSLYEGFGLPVLESMARLLPVIAGNNSSIPEVIGDTTYLCEDLNLDQWAFKTKELLLLSVKNPDILNNILETNQKRARTFSWDKTAINTLLSYRKFANSPNLFSNNQYKESDSNLTSNKFANIKSGSK